MWLAGILGLNLPQHFSVFLEQIHAIEASKLRLVKEGIFGMDDGSAVRGGVEGIV